MFKSGGGIHNIFVVVVNQFVSLYQPASSPEERIRPGGECEQGSRGTQRLHLKDLGQRKWLLSKV